MTTTQSYQNSDKICYNEEHEQVQMIICTPVSQTLSVFSTSGSAAVIVCQKLSFLLKLRSHTYRCTRTASLFSFLQTSVPSFIECCYSQPPDEEQGPQVTHRCCDTFRIRRKWIDSLRAHERSGLCSLSLRFYSLNFWFRFSTSAFQNETRRRMIQSWQNTDL